MSASTPKMTPVSAARVMRAVSTLELEFVMWVTYVSAEGVAEDDGVHTDFSRGVYPVDV